MSLDIAILGPDGGPAREVRVGVDEHARLMMLAEGLPLVSRLEDYYEDAEYASSEIPSLLTELLELRALSDGSPGLRKLLDELVELMQEVAARSAPISAIAD